MGSVISDMKNLGLRSAQKTHCKNELKCRKALFNKNYYT